MISFDLKETEKWILTSEGREISLTGSHEAKVYNAIPAEKGISIDDLTVSFFSFC